MAKSLKYFMRESAKTEEVVTVPGIPSITDENGKVVDFEIRILNQKHIRKIQNSYKTREIARDKKGNPLIANGEVVWKTTRDTDKSLNHLIVEALQYPNLKDKELMSFFGCVDITEMPLLVFSTTDEYNAVSNMVIKTLGIIPDEDKEEKNEADLEAAKN